jgi:biofilm PGA synthesis N-glycosyltransferase PgaC
MQVNYHIIGNLDGDISFDKDYLAFLLQKFYQIPELGVAGTPFLEDGYSSATDSFEGENHVAGGCQLFRRTCFEDIGGYVPNKAGGIDWIAVTTARMKGWKTMSFQDKFFTHYRHLGTGESNRIKALFDYGKKDYYLGGHPVWELFRIMYRMLKKPYIYGGLFLFFGYLWALVTRMKIAISKDLMKFHRREQMQKLKLILKRLIQFKKVDKFYLTKG